MSLVTNMIALFKGTATKNDPTYNAFSSAENRLSAGNMSLPNALSGDQSAAGDIAMSNFEASALDYQTRDLQNHVYNGIDEQFSTFNSFI